MKKFTFCITAIFFTITMVCAQGRNEEYRGTTVAIASGGTTAATTLIQAWKARPANATGASNIDKVLPYFLAPSSSGDKSSFIVLFDGGLNIAGVILKLADPSPKSVTVLYKETKPTPKDIEAFLSLAASCARRSFNVK